MAAHDSDTNWFVHALAVVAGTFAMLVPFLLTRLWGEPLSQFALDIMMCFSATYAVLGAVFGFLWPESKWRWGVWVSVVPVILFSFMGGGALRFLLFAGLTLFPACAGAYTAARFHLNYTRTN